MTLTCATSPLRCAPPRSIGRRRRSPCRSKGSMNRLCKDSINRLCKAPVANLSTCGTLAMERQRTHARTHAHTHTHTTKAPRGELADCCEESVFILKRKACDPAGAHGQAGATLPPPHRARLPPLGRKKHCKCSTRRPPSRDSRTGRSLRSS